MNVKYDIWAVGQTSRRLGSKMAQSENTDDARKVSVVLIDRDLDVVPCVSHGPSTLERVMDLLESYGTCDVKVNTGPLFGEGLGTDDIFGTLVHPEANNSQNYLDMAIGKSIKQFTAILLEKLKEVMPAASSENTNTETATNINTETTGLQKESLEMLKALDKCADDWNWVGDNTLLFDWCTAVTQASQCSIHSAYDQAMAIEKV